MGKKLDLSQLTDAEAEHVWGVIQRDLALRRAEEQRLRGLKGEIQRESAKREAPPEGEAPHPPQCPHCLQPRQPQDAPGSQCRDCGLSCCPRCGPAPPDEGGWLCHPCHLARVVQIGSLDWYYGHLRARFKRFGSAKVIRSLSGRLQGTGAALGTGEGSGDSEQTDEEVEPQPRGGKTKRRLSIHGLDLLDSQDVTLNHSESLEGTLVAEEADASDCGRQPGPREQTTGPPPGPRDALAGQRLPAELKPKPGPDDPWQLQAPPEGWASLASICGDAPLGPPRSSPPSPEGQGPPPTDADREEAALRTKLAQLVTHLSEDEEDGGPRGVGRAEPQPQSPGGPAEGCRNADQELAELEDRVAAAACGVQQAESEVTDIQSRIAALQSAGLTVQPSTTRQRTSHLPVLLPRRIRRPDQRPGNVPADAPEQDLVVAAARPQGATLRGSPGALAASPRSVPPVPGAAVPLSGGWAHCVPTGSTFERDSLYRSSLTQRNPTGRSAAARLGFAGLVHDLTSPSSLFLLAFLPDLSPEPRPPPANGDFLPSPRAPNEAGPLSPMFV
ncbi:melanophilin [Sorex fumeus]|uniref:melanophilin n=1 Tax=Sorex fumeus TaxID=62283 RepID=UPI0024AE838D|nr:melanophilin [Sorex fumeus]